MVKEITAVIVATAILMIANLAEAQQPKKIPRIGYLTGQRPTSSDRSSPNVEAFRQGLRDLGYTEGKNIIIEYRGADGELERLPQLVAELVGLGVNIIVTSGMPAVIAAKQGTGNIPIVAANADNLVEAGVVASLARPGGNVTGSTRVDADFTAKRLELLKESFPKLSRVAVLSHGAIGGDQEELQEIKTRARTLGVQIQTFPVQEPIQFRGAYAEMKKRRADALIIFNSSFTTFHRRQLVELAIKNRLPTMCANIAWIDVWLLHLLRAKRYRIVPARRGFRG